ncbi:hypothetical protein RhiirA5_481983 [Rhizophagus irregularis]|uniref:Uncharacterized protein n=1 Tax=Rhizophagus irregularis TaxID=588596 RepID=A0A2N0PIT9_9GLOM|nr:hypothetical protein RhiirA5_481983 [Rhizophagus irregularis]
MAGLQEDVMYGIVSTAVDWVMIKLVSSSSSSSDNNSEGKVDVLLSSLFPFPLPINKAILIYDNLVEPINKDLFGQIKWVFDSQIESQGLSKRLEVLCDKNKIGEKKARGLIYNEVMKQINILHKKRSQDTGVPLPNITRDGLCKKIQKAEKIYKLLKKIGLDKIQYIKSYSANEISKFTNDEIQKIMDYFSNKPSTDFSENQDNFINDDSSNQTDTLEVQVNPLVSAKSVKETNKEVVSQLREKTNENKSDNNSDFNDSEEEIPNDSDDDEYNGYGGYNEYVSFINKLI